MAPVLLLIPGMTNTPRVWDRVRAHLQAEVQRGVEVRVTDVRASADIPAMAATAWRELQDVPLERPLAIAGFSMGGYVALQMVVSAPRPVQALALVCTSARPDNPAVAPMRERATAAAQRDWERYITSVASALASPDTQADPQLMQAIRGDLREAGVDATVAQQRAVAQRADQRPLLATLKLKALVIAGALDPLISPAHSKEAADAIAGARWREVEGAGHLLPWERPQALAAAMDEWLAGL
jgi:pimeloyl-ACP methyl ester carboxylesterase